MIMRKLKKGLCLVCILIITLLSCKKDSLNTYDVDGVAQKGPYIVGSVVTISELDNHLNQTGKNYTTTIIDDQGKFEIPDIEFASNYVQISVDGSYYNELADFVIPDRLILNSIANLEEKRTINVNILTHLEIDRLKYLIKEENHSFFEAKIQCLNEIRKIFEIDSMVTLSSEELDISKTDNVDIELIAISSIIQAGRNVASLTELLTRIRLDIKEDGTLDSENLQSELITSAVFIDCEKISRNIKKRYSNLGLEIATPDIRPVIDSFVTKSDYPKLVDIEIPKSTEFGPNILALGDTVYIDTNQSYCLAINQICKKGILITWIEFEDIETNYCRENIEIKNIQNWGDFPLEHPFGSNEPMYFSLVESFTGNSTMQITFKDHGQININMFFDCNIDNILFAYNSKTQYLEW
jgi:hypothetical protein